MISELEKFRALAIAQLDQCEMEMIDFFKQNPQLLMYGLHAAHLAIEKAESEGRSDLFAKLITYALHKILASDGYVSDLDLPGEIP